MRTTGLVVAGTAALLLGPLAAADRTQATHLLEVRWTAAAFSYTKGTAVPHEGKGTSSFAWKAGFDIVWQDPTLTGAPGNWGPYALGPAKVLDASGEIANDSSAPGVSCGGTFTPFVPSKIQASLGGLVWVLPNPAATQGWTPSAPDASVCHGFPDWSHIGWPASRPNSLFTPAKLPAPPYAPSANSDSVRSIDALLYVDPKTLTAQAPGRPTASTSW